MSTAAAVEHMTRTPTQVEEWTGPLSVFTPGMSLADVVLVTQLPPHIVMTTPTRVTIHSLSLNTIPDTIQAGLDAEVFYFLTPRGLDKTLSIQIPPDSDAEDITDREAAIELRNESGLSVDALARMAKVSRVTYHKWLAGSGVSQENAQRLRNLLATFRTLHGILGGSLPEFLEQDGDLGKPIELLEHGDFAAAIGMALRPFSSPAMQKTPTIRQESNLPGWLPARSLLAWGGTRLSEAELDEALDRISPAPYIESSQANELTTKDDESVYKVSGFYLE